MFSDCEHNVHLQAFLTPPDYPSGTFGKHFLVQISLKYNCLVAAQNCDVCFK
jgi:hypothetical protein